jgi:hypothetical protein
LRVLGSAAVSDPLKPLDHLARVVLSIPVLDQRP